MALAGLLSVRLVSVMEAHCRWLSALRTKPSSTSNTSRGWPNESNDALRADASRVDQIVDESRGMPLHIAGSSTLTRIDDHVSSCGRIVL